MTINVAPLPETAAPPASARGNAPTVSSTVVNDVAALARQQLPSAVPATALIAAYSGNVAPAPKQTVRLAPPVSSALAAQFIAQTPEATAEDLEIFVTRAPAAPASETQNDADDFLNTIRMARGDFSHEKQVQNPAARPTQTTVETAARENAAAIAKPVTPEPVLRGTLAPLTHLPPVQVMLGRKPTINNARGLSAYQLAQDRNAATKKTPELAVP